MTVKFKIHGFFDFHVVEVSYLLQKANRMTKGHVSKGFSVSVFVAIDDLKFVVYSRYPHSQVLRITVISAVCFSFDCMSGLL